jgi:hypothetical protein
VVDNLDIGMDLVNQFAPEHFEIIVREPRMWLKKVRSAGAVFIGPWTPECAGDFVAGPSHVLPTGGTAAMFSGLVGGLVPPPHQLRVLHPRRPAGRAARHRGSSAEVESWTATRAPPGSASRSSAPAGGPG